MTYMPKIKETRHLVESCKNRQCATFWKVISESLFSRDDFYFFYFFSFSRNLHAHYQEGLCNFRGSGNFLTQCITYFLSSRDGFHIFHHEGWDAIQKYEVLKLMVGLPRGIAQFLEAIPLMLQGEVKRLLVVAKFQIKVKTKSHKKHIKI